MDAARELGVGVKMVAGDHATIAREVARGVHLGAVAVQSLLFLKLAVAGHLTIFAARTRGPFWSIRPSGALFWSALVTKVLATLAAVYGVHVEQLGWPLAGMVWAYCLAAFVITDLLKVLVYRVLDHSELVFSR